MSQKRNVVISCVILPVLAALALSDAASDANRSQFSAASNEKHCELQASSQAPTNSISEYKALADRIVAILKGCKNTNDLLVGMTKQFGKPEREKPGSSYRAWNFRDGNIAIILSGILRSSDAPVSATEITLSPITSSGELGGTLGFGILDWLQAIREKNSKNIHVLMAYPGSLFFSGRGKPTDFRATGRFAGHVLLLKAFDKSSLETAGTMEPLVGVLYRGILGETKGETVEAFRNGEVTTEFKGTYFDWTDKDNLKVKEEIRKDQPAAIWIGFGSLFDYTMRSLGPL